MTSALTASQLCLYKKLCHDLGNEITGYLLDSSINDITANPDGSLWIDSFVHGQQQVGTLSYTQRLSIINDVADISHVLINAQFPCLEVNLPHFKMLQGQRFAAIVPPVTSSPCFSIKKRSEQIYSLDDYVASGRITLKQQKVLCDLIKARRNILVCGAIESGKTTIINALMHEAVKHDPLQRFLILENNHELQCTARNQISLLANCNFNINLLLRMAMVFKPNRILIDEIKGAEALDMLKAWNNGSSGGICTLYANNAQEAAYRILELVMEAGLAAPPIALVTDAIDVIVFVTKHNNHQGYVQDILELVAYQHGQFVLESLV